MNSPLNLIGEIKLFISSIKESSFQYFNSNYKSSILLLTKTLGFIILFLFLATTTKVTLSKLWLSSDFSSSTEKSIYGIYFLLGAFFFGLAFPYTYLKDRRIHPIDFLIIFSLYYIHQDKSLELLPLKSDLKFVDIVLLLPLIAGVISNWDFIKEGFWFRYRLSGIKQIYNDNDIFVPDLDIKEIAKSNALKSGKSYKDELIKVDAECLNFNPLAKEIANLLLGIKPDRAFSVGIEGDWGTGKSSLIELLKINIPDRYNDFKITQVNFTPWLYPDEKSLTTNFFKTWQEKLSIEFDISAAFSEYGDIVTKAEKEFIKTEFLSFLFKKDSSFKSQKERIESIFKKRKEIFYFFIDDLDRLGKDEIVEVIKLCRILADFPNTIYVLAYDRAYVNSAISILNTDQSKQNQFLDKIIQIEFKLPAIQDQKLIQVLTTLLKEQLDKLGLSRSPQHWELEELCNKSYLTKYLRNVRDVKRFTNSFLLRYRLCHFQVDFETFLLFELFFYKYKSSYGKLFERRKDWIKYCEGKSDLNSIPLSELTQFLGIEVTAVQDVLLILNDVFFRKVAYRNFNSNPDPYFVLAGSDEEVSAEDYNLWYKSDTFLKMQLLTSWLDKNLLSSFIQKAIAFKDTSFHITFSKNEISTDDRRIENAITNFELIAKLLFKYHDYENAPNKYNDALISLFIAIENDVKDTVAISDKLIPILLSKISLEVLKEGINKGFNLIVITETENETEIISDSSTQYVKSLSPQLSKPPFNISGASYEYLSSTKDYNDRIEELKGVPWITRANPLDSLECGKDFSPIFLFTKEFYSLVENEQVDSALLYIQVDDYSKVYLNGKFVGEKNGFHLTIPNIAEPLEVKELLKIGKNLLSFEIRNDAHPSSNPVSDNPYGFAYKLVVTLKNRRSHYLSKPAKASARNQGS